jgi:hypothetical protein
LQCDRRNMTKKSIFEPAREISVRTTCDVFVAGAGTAGVVAAIAAARNGADTVLVEQLPLPSGTMTNGGIVANSYYSTYTQECTEPKRIVEGIAKEIQDRVIAAGGCPGGIKIDAQKSHYHRPYLFINDPEVYKAVISQMLMEAGVKVYLHTFLSGVLKDDQGRPYGAIIESKAGREAVLAKCFIDCTGDGDLAVHAGAKPQAFYQEYNVRPLASVGKMFGISNVNMSKFMDYAQENGMIRQLFCGKKFSDGEDYVRIAVNFLAEESCKAAAEKAGFRSATFFSIHENTIDFVNGIGRQNVNIMNLDELSNIEMEMQIIAHKFLVFLKENLPGFEGAFLKSTANQIGIRASQVVETDFVPSIEEITASARYDDEIGMYGHSDYMPVDEISVMRNKGMYGLPYRMLLPKGVDNVLVAGRMVSTNLRSHMSTRNTISCMIQGQAAGTAASICARDGLLPRELPYERLREKLVADGVYFEPRD